MSGEPESLPPRRARPPDYLGSECLIEALYRRGRALAGPVVSCECARGLRLRSPPGGGHPGPLRAGASSLLYIYSFICWRLIPHYRDRFSDKRAVLGNTQCRPSSSAAAHKREEEARPPEEEEAEEEAPLGIPRGSRAPFIDGVRATRPRDSPGATEKQCIRARRR